MQDSIFTKIIKGEIPSHKVYEDSRTIAFMDINPVQTGMVLVVPKIQIDHFMDLSIEDYDATMTTVRKVAKKMHHVFPDKRIAVIIEGFEVPHAHIKLIPIAEPEELRALPNAADPDHEALAQMAKTLTIE